MPQKFNKILNQLTLAIHSTDNSFGFAYRKDNNNESDIFYIKNFDNDLCNNLIVDFNKFIPIENLEKVNKISVSIGPANFNASRLIVVLARTISQQIQCPLESFSSFELMSKRIALKNNIFKKNKSFWIYKELKRKGFIAGKYEVCFSDNKNKSLTMREKVLPKVIKELDNSEPNFKADYDDEEDLKELLNLSNKNIGISNFNSWEKVLPLYPLSPIN
tara:strand:+ start:417 stop:1070 length:654 start_codon:yes stop_codon:yes gene_type:complete